MEVHFEKESVIESFLAVPKAQRQALFTYRQPQLIGLIQSINSALILKQTVIAGTQLRTYEVLESMETYWTDPVYLQIKDKFLKGRNLIKLLEDNYSDFLSRPKTLFLSDSEYSEVAMTRVPLSWEDFQIMISELLEQTFLRIHYEKAENEAKKNAAALIFMEMQKGTEKKPKRKKAKFVQYDSENLQIDLISDTSTQPDSEIDSLDSFVLDSNFSGYKSYHIRNKYKGRKLEISGEMLAKIREEMEEVHIDWEDLAELSVVQDYYSQYPPYYVWNPQVEMWASYPQLYR